MKIQKYLLRLTVFTAALFTPVCTFAADNVAITEANFPDAILRQYVQENFDTDNNSVLSDAELLAVTEIIVTQKKIKSLAGIEYFTSLTDLDCSVNSLSTLNVNNNTALTDLDCSFNSLSTLGVNNNTALTYLDCAYNSLSTLDVSNNIALTDLYCSHNSLSTLDVSKNIALTYLSCDNNPLSTLDVSKNTALTNLNCRNQYVECKNVISQDGIFKLDMREVVGVENIDSVSVETSSLVASYEDGIVTFSTDPAGQSFEYEYSLSYGDGYAKKMDVTLNLTTGSAVESVKGSRLSVYTVSEGIVVSGVENAEVSVYDISGVGIGSFSSVTGQIEIPVPQAGIYVVKCGDNATKVLVK